MRDSWVVKRGSWLESGIENWVLNTIVGMFEVEPLARREKYEGINTAWDSR